MVKRITAKYDSDISSAWETSPVKGYLDNGYVFKSSVTSKYYSYLEKMPGQDITMTATQWDGNTYTWYYWLEILPGQDTTGLDIREDNGVTYYKYHTTSVNGNSISLTYEEDYFPITGFTQRDSTVPSFSNRIAHLHYLRNQYNLKFINNGDVAKTGDYLYEASIEGTNFTPTYPEDLEANAYVFDGWYTSEFATEESRFEFSGATMPATDLVLYANWVPKSHSVNVYLVNDNGTLKKQVGETQTVPHGSTATDPGTVTHPDSANYQFISWFYKDGDTEKAFDFSMPINRDMNIYAKWSSVAMVEYTIRYAVEDANGNRTYIADATTGKALADTTKTFEAKTGEDLKADYQSGYFPTTNSHSMTMKITGNNEFTFIYVPKTQLPYVVKYLEEGTGKELADPVLKETRDAIVTEKFVPITGYMPDAYQKRLVLSATEAQNVITFWYTKDEEHAPVQVIHYLQNAEGDGYTLYMEASDLNSKIGSLYSADVLTNITGAEFARATANGSAVPQSNGKVSGTVQASGLLLELYYDRGVYPYEFRFLEQGTNNVLATAEGGNARYGKQVTQNAKTVDGYDCVSGDAQAMTIQIEDGDMAVKNVKVFYYVEKTATINYVVKGPAGCGSVDRASETVKVFSGDASGSTPTAADGYRFVGWFTDEACTSPVDGTWVTNNKINPAKVNGKNVAATYYAKFDYNLTSLTIEKTGSNIDGNQTFLFTVTDSQGAKVADVVITGDGQTTISGLTVGETYTVTEKTSWSWRYDCDGAVASVDKKAQYDKNAHSIAVELTSDGETVIFTNDKTNSKWLSAVTKVINTWTDNGINRNPAPTSGTTN